MLLKQQKVKEKQKMGTSFEYGKTLAGEGSILLILGIVPTIGWVLGIIGIVLFMRGMRELANYYQDNEIYQNSLTGVKYYIVALIAAAVAITALVVGITSAPSIGGITNFGTIGFAVGITAFIAGIVIAFVFYILASSHLRQTLNTLAEKTGEHSFATAGTLLWVGSILTIIVVGLLLIFIAWIFATIGFFSMRSKPQPQPYSYTPPATATITQPEQRYCPNCGSPVAPDAAYCSHCGKQLTT
jgi:uncharacterized membrane protein